MAKRVTYRVVGTNPDTDWTETTDFATEAEARRYREEMATRFPGDRWTVVRV